MNGFHDIDVDIFHGSAEKIPLADCVVQTCITSPPYFGLRDYGVEGQIGLEVTPDEYIERLVSVFREVRRVLRDDGTVWLNLGDSYANDGKWGGHTGGKHCKALHGGATALGRNKKYTGYKPKDLMGIPWQVAFALRADGWYLRQDIIWHKPSPMPESIKDRCTKAHEYIFLLSKSERYYFNAEAIAEEVTDSTIARQSQDLENQAGSKRAYGGTDDRPMKSVVRKVNGGACFGKQRDPIAAHSAHAQSREFHRPIYDKRNKRSVWTVAAVGYPGAHFATFPPKLIEPCILAGSKPGDLVLDPFSGTATTGEVARKHGRRYAGMEINAEYIELCKERFTQRPLFDAAAGGAA